MAPDKRLLLASGRHGDPFALALQLALRERRRLTEALERTAASRSATLLSGRWVGRSRSALTVSWRAKPLLTQPERFWGSSL